MDGVRRAQSLNSERSPGPIRAPCVNVAVPGPSVAGKRVVEPLPHMYGKCTSHVICVKQNSHTRIGAERTPGPAGLERSSTGVAPGERRLPHTREWARLRHGRRDACTRSAPLSVDVAGAGGMRYAQLQRKSVDNPVWKCESPSSPFARRGLLAEPSFARIHREPTNNLQVRIGRPRSASRS